MSRNIISPECDEQGCATNAFSFFKVGLSTSTQQLNVFRVDLDVYQRQTVMLDSGMKPCNWLKQLENR